ncbi:preprotein translocase subunit YajC [Nocardia takedensis]|uniref:preprotein translocase subunit YajC n=1 Tax=Nocardia takedensis TaxID=259390 RepID=UPI0005937BE1|nr:preprotein translocase subunit YajC [Nocardia takedensis]
MLMKDPFHPQSEIPQARFRPGDQVRVMASNLYGTVAELKDEQIIIDIDSDSFDLRCSHDELELVDATFGEFNAALIDHMRVDFTADRRSIAEIAAEAGMQADSLTSVLEGRSTLDVSHMIVLAEILGTNASTWFRRAEGVVALEEIAGSMKSLPTNTTRGSNP